MCSGHDQAISGARDIMTREYFQTHVPADGEFETIIEAEAEIDEEEASSDADYRNLILSKGGEITDEWNDDAPFAIQVDRENNLNRTLVRDYPVAVGYYLHALETHGIPEDSALVGVGEEVDMHRFLEWNKDLSERDRRLRLIDLLEWRVEEGGDWAAEIYLEEHSCSFRDKGLTEYADVLVEQLARQVDLRPKMCYWTAQKAALLHKDNHRVEYAEGIALPKQGAQVSRHAWIEIDGKVVELTWPWHHFDGREAIYYGTTVPIEEVAEARERRLANGAILLDDEEVMEIGQQMSSDGKIHPKMGE